MLALDALLERVGVLSVFRWSRFPLEVRFLAALLLWAFLQEGFFFRRLMKR